MDDETKAVLREATKAHKSGQFESAIELYRRVVSKSDDPAPAILLANLLISAPAPTTIQGLARRAQASALAERALAALDTLPSNKAKAALLARHGYFLLQSAGAFRVGNNASDSSAADSHDEEGESSLASSSSAPSNLTAVQKLAVEQAVTSFERAAELDPTAVIAWRNAAVAYKSLGRPKDVERALGKAIQCSLSATAASAAAPASASSTCEIASLCGSMSDSGKAALVDLLYRHSKALKGLNDHDAALARLFDVLALDPRHLLAGFWLRVAAADVASDGPSSKSLSASTIARLKDFVAKEAPTGEDGSTGSGCPHAYVSRLFDGYATRFDSHLTGALGYRTPTVLLQLALQAAGSPSVKWRRCADLGCGTGLAGEQFRPHLLSSEEGGFLAGVDLSSGMIQEAKVKRPGVYSRLDVDSCEAWLEKEVKDEEAGKAGGYDLVLAADVFVYIGDLKPIFKGVTDLLPRASAPHPVPLFIFSTEADLSAPQQGDPDSFKGQGFTLTGTGRVVHSRGYILRLAREHGLRPVVAVTRMPIRQNAGKDVIGDLFVLTPAED